MRTLMLGVGRGSSKQHARMRCCEFGEEVGALGWNSGPCSRSGRLLRRIPNLRTYDMLAVHVCMHSGQCVQTAEVAHRSHGCTVFVQRRAP